MIALVHNPAEYLSRGVLRNSGGRLGDTDRHGIHLDHEARDDDANILPASFLVGVEREAGAPASKQFDAGYSIDVNVLHGNGLHQTRSGVELTHLAGSPIIVPLYGTLGIEHKRHSVRDYRFREIVMVPSRNFRGSIREPDALSRYRNNKRLSSFRDFLSDFWFRFLPRGFASTQTALGRNAVRQLAESANALSVFFSAFIRSRKSPPRTANDRLESFSSPVRLPVHVKQSITGTKACLSINNGQLIQ